MNIKKKKILIVEDEKHLREAYFRILKKNSDYEIDLASSAEDGLGLFRAVNHDLVITDIELPAMDGMELIEKLKKINSAIKILVISGSVICREGIMEKGVLDFMEKPVDIKTLRDTVAKYLKSF